MSVAPLPYTPSFYEAVTEGSLRSARVVVPLVLDLLGALRPSSVVDVGCGAGAWASVFSEQGISTVRGLDGEHVPRSALLLPAESFAVVDLEQPFTQDRQFDLAVCLEVAEHVPERSALGLVQSLCRLAPLVLFSAAVPGQGGTGHMNEQWPWYWRYWFAAQGYRMFDPFRARLFHDRRVEWWYRQNLFLFANGELVAESMSLQELPEVRDDFGLLIVAPQVLGARYYRRS